MRFGIAMERDLLDRLDGLVARRRLPNRSEALRDLVRRELDSEAWAQNARVCVTITLVYDHHVRELTERLNEVQHDHGEQIVSTMHVHLDHHHCMEIIAARGSARDLKTMSDRLIGTKGVLSGGVVAVSMPGAGAASGRRCSGANDGP
ncbi:MAG: nickel-responsive transcriptional regulator NikR [Polyangiaceae bacterium]